VREAELEHDGELFLKGGEEADKGRKISDREREIQLDDSQAISH
jgi:hypothetical protein